jgi:hypothetical protein
MLRTFALSLSIFWRALPCWALLFGVLYALANFLSASPILFGLLMMLSAGTIMVFMMFVHIRSGLIVADVVTPTDVGKLFKRSFKFFRFFVMMNALMTGLTVASFYVACQFGMFDLEATLNTLKYGTEDEWLAMVQGFTGVGVYTYLTVMQILSQLFYAALAVPMAANAAACSPKTRDTEVFWGFGAFVGRMFLLNLVSGTLVTIMVLLYVFVGLAMPVFDGQSLMQITDASQILTPQDTSSYLMIAALVFLPIAGIVWMVSLWCAGATLCFLEHRDKLQAEKNRDMACVYERPLSVNELRDLRQSRMGGGMPA